MHRSRPVKQGKTNSVTREALHRESGVPSRAP